MRARNIITINKPVKGHCPRQIQVSDSLIALLNTMPKRARNYPVKGHRPRMLNVSNKLLAMINALPKTSERVFPTNYRSMYTSFKQVRKRVAKTKQNPRILKITPVTFRHWGATMVYSFSKNILLVQKLLGHKKIQNTMKYTQLIQFKDDEYQVAAATTVDEAKDLIASGYEYIIEKNGIMLFRRPKRYTTYG